LRAIAAEMVAGAGAAASARRVDLRLAEGEAAPVRGEAFLLGQAVSNLVQNALEFTPAGGTVTVAVTVAAGRVRVVVDDSGPGVPDYALARVGERFYSLPRPDTGRKSTGLGLSIVREIARLHGGEFGLTNRARGGARAEFSVAGEG
jgi:two-component system sensor histidine kinase CreC